MNNKVIITGGVLIVTILFVMAFMIFNTLGITSGNVKRNSITVVTGSASKTWDGNALSNDEWHIESGKLNDEHEIEVVMASSITEPGSIDNEIGITILDEEGVNITNIYSIEYKLGALEVNPIHLQLRTASQSKIYDGATLSDESWNIQSGRLKEGHYYEYVMPSSIQMPGSIDNEIDFMIFDENDEKVTQYYDITYNLGSLTILGKEIVIETSSDKKTYDGEPLRSNNWQLVSGTLLDTHDINYTMDSSITEPGFMDNEVAITILDENNNDMTGIYDITYNFGQLEVERRSLFIKTNSASKDYDGTPLTNHEWHISSGQLADNHEIQEVMPTSLVEPDTVDNEIGVTILDENGNDVSAYYEIDKDLGTLSVFGRPLTIETSSKTKSYDGEPLTSHDWSIIEGSIPENHYYEYEMPSILHEPNLIENAIELMIFDENGNDVTNIYEIDFVLGYLDLNQIDLLIQTKSADKVFDGYPLDYDQTYEIIEGEILSNHDLDYDFHGAITYPDSIDNEIDIAIFDQDGQDVSELYNIKYDFGTLSVEHRMLEISTHSASKLYDGEPLKEPNWNIANGELFEDHYKEIFMNKEILEPGSLDNDFSIYIYDANGQDVTKGYNIIDNLGELEVKAIPLTISTGSDSKVYDGTELIFDDWEIEFGALLDGHTIENFGAPSITDPQDIKNEIGFRILDENQSDVSRLYDLTMEFGTLEVHPLEIVIETLSASKVYDGAPLTHEEWNISYGELYESHELIVHQHTEAIEPGEKDNALQFKIIDSEGRNVEDKYEIESNYGTLTVEPISIVILSSNASKIYDGEPLTNEQWEKKNGEILPEHHLEVYVTGQRTEIGVSKNSFDALVFGSDGQNVSRFYDFEYIKGELEVVSDPYSEGSLSQNPFDLPDQDLFRFKSNHEETLYFRGASRGNYNGSGWSQGKPHDLDLSINPLSFPSKAMEASGYEIYNVDVEYLREQMPYLIPYYNVGDYQTLNDIDIGGDRSEIVSFDFISQYGNDLTSISLEGTNYASDELKYRSFVYDEYLNVQTSTRNAMLELADINSLDEDSDTLIYDVQQYIMNAATYDMDFEPIPEGEDVAVYFLTESKEGICQHYATAAALMYRTLGVPARYVTGYIGVGEVSQWNTVNHEYGHAWVEVYIDGLGWIPVEVTGSTPATDLDSGDGLPGFNDENGDGENGGGENGDGENGDGENGDEDPEEELIEITIRPITNRDEYQSGKTITAEALRVSGFEDYIEQGYTYSYEFGGVMNEPGIKESYVSSFTIYDAENNDVTQLFDVNDEPGVLQLYLHEIDLYTDHETKKYDGTALQGDSYTTSGEFEPGHYIDNIQFTTSQTNVGSSLNRAELTILNQEGEEVNDLYYVRNNFGVLMVSPAPLTIESESDEKTFDGTVLENHSFSVSENLADNHTIDIEVTGSQTNIGRSPNTVQNVTILDENNQDVTSNYSLEIIEGELTVRPPS